MASKLVTAPTAEPVSLTEAKAHLRIDGTADDTLITTLITTARQMAEELTRRALITQTWDLWLDRLCGGAVELPRAPLASVTAVYYFQTDDAQQTFSASSYNVDTASEPGRVALRLGEIWPTDLRPTNGLQVRYVAGYGSTAADVPGPIKQAILQAIGHLYENRESQQLPPLARTLLLPYRVVRL